MGSILFFTKTLEAQTKKTTTLNATELICQVFWLNAFETIQDCIDAIPLAQEEFMSTSDFDMHVAHYYRERKNGSGVVFSVSDTWKLQHVLTIIRLLKHSHTLTLEFEIFSEHDDVYNECKTHAFLHCRRLPRHEPIRDRYFMYKAIAIAQSHFQHVLFLDSDSIPLINPMDFFHSQEYQLNHALFWPDLWGAHCIHRSKELGLFPSPGVYGQSGYPNHVIWHFMNIEWNNQYVFTQEMESGQIVIDSVTKFDIIQVAYKCSMNEFLQKVLLGDKDCWRIAALWLHSKFYYEPHTPSEIGTYSNQVFRREYLLQYFQGAPAFIHQYKATREIKEIENYYVYQYPEINTTHTSNCPPVYTDEFIDQLKPGFKLFAFNNTFMLETLSTFNDIYFNPN